MDFRGFQTVVCKEAGVGPYFSVTIRERLRQKLATNIVVTGEPGIGKSYLAIDLARILEGKTASGHDRFKINQVVFDFRSFMDLTLHLGMGKAIVFDEPSYAMGKRDWYKDLNKALVQTIESKRFKVHPLIIPVINKSLLDRTVRNYLLQFQVIVTGRGLASVYRLQASQSEEKIYRHFICNLRYGLFDSNLCARDTCLDCDKLPSCGIFRAVYERRKAAVQEVRYEEALEEASHKESAHMTDGEIEKLAYQNKAEIVNAQNKLDATKIRLILWENQHIKIGMNRAYTIRSMLQMHHPNEFTMA